MAWTMAMNLIREVPLFGDRFDPLNCYVEILLQLERQVLIQTVPPTLNPLCPVPQTQAFPFQIRPLSHPLYMPIT